FASVAASAQSPSEQEEAAKQRQRAADNVAAIASILSSIERRQAIEDQRRAEDEPRNWGESLWDAFWSQKTSSWALTIFGAFTLGIAVKTLKSLRREVVATARAAHAAQRSADSARLTLEIANTSILELKRCRRVFGTLDVIVGYTVFNPSPVLARDITLVADFGIGGLDRSGAPGTIDML